MNTLELLKNEKLTCASQRSFIVHAAKFTEGNYYKILDQPQSTTPVVTEFFSLYFFSLYCPHCFQFEPMMRELKTKLPDNVKFQQMHVSFMGGSMGKVMSKAFATAVVLNVTDKMVPVLFNRIHTLNQPPRNEAEVRQIFIDEGVPAAEFDGAFNSFAVNSMVTRFDKSFEDAGLTGVPAVIVNNKYLVKTGKIKSADEYFELVNFLLKK
ncbi:thiol:disulfide interchange protein [Photobacterium kishitanii]|uniref:Thiol:disulfide interchange protein n=1 Tax=Photobacterium kishitanii TaxID=318456 RepID=A0AAX0YUZ5_9GAMM|nr:thiol:disulfide interchange protein DsbA/DsbL [Photobacterium kishitanii]KJG54217.1 thiol:disulfide interchange protein [Photobacterium kishitanii]KJG56094.1 thiol:disulfide interchange protein [Photobacterium kishitanii]KJG62830.1 thiol:disulfide interchange protein [Photobacterium kishitanii]KJG64743.1 thiol:disulfide interchange protein [Photobacterium kishitanii]PSX18261.1 thiol:disulfide interchange protein DsbA/DsbL [Photobacterium kishitanii]